VCSLCSKHELKLWAFWDVDSETLKAWKNEEDRELMRTCDVCIKTLREKSAAEKEELAGGAAEVAKRRRGSLFTEESLRLSAAKEGVKNQAESKVKGVSKTKTEEEIDNEEGESQIVCCVCRCDLAFLEGWGVYEVNQLHTESDFNSTNGERPKMYVCDSCNIQTVYSGERRRYRVFVRDIPPWMCNEDVHDNFVKFGDEHGRENLKFEIARCEITLDRNCMPYLSDTGKARAIIELYKKDAQKWLLTKKFVTIFRDNSRPPEEETAEMVLSSQPLGVWDRGGKFTMNLSAAVEVAQKKMASHNEKRVQKRILRANRRAHGGVLRCPGRLGGCVGGLQEKQHKKTGRCPECGGLRVSRDELVKGRRMASYDDAIDAARMNDEARLNGIFSLVSRRVTKKGKPGNGVKQSGQFTSPTFHAEDRVQDGDEGASRGCGKSFRGQTPLHVAAMSGSYESVKVLLALNHIKEPEDPAADIPPVRLPLDVYNSTPMHSAAMAGHAKILALLLHHGAKKVVNNRMKRLPLHYAAANGHFECCKILLQSEKEQLYMKDIFDKTALDLARKSKEPNAECIAYMTKLYTDTA
jgi:hypothetical protein